MSPSSQDPLFNWDDSSHPNALDQEEVRSWYPSSLSLDESQPIILDGTRSIPKQEFLSNQERYFARFQTACRALQDCAEAASEDDVWTFYDGTGFGLSPTWWAFWKVVDISELMIKVRLGVPSLTATILGNKDFQLTDLQHLPKFPHESIVLFGSYFLFIVRAREGMIPEHKGYTGKSCQDGGVSKRTDEHVRIINCGKVPNSACFLYEFGMDPDTSIKSVGMAYRSFPDARIKYISQVVEGINCIIFDMIAFHVPGRHNKAHAISSGVESLIHDIRNVTETNMADGIKLPSLQGLNRSFPFAEHTDFRGSINIIVGETCSVANCDGRAEYHMNPLNPQSGIVCSEHRPGDIPRECHNCGLLDDSEITERPFRISAKDMKRFCIVCYTDKEKKWYRWDTAEATARMLFPEWRQYQMARLATSTLQPTEYVCIQCLHVYVFPSESNCHNRCGRCQDRPASCLNHELKDWSLTHFQPDGGRDDWFRKTAVSLRKGVGLVRWSRKTPVPLSFFMTGVSKVPSPISEFCNENITLIKGLKPNEKIFRVWFPGTYQKLLDLRADGRSWRAVAEGIGHISEDVCRRKYIELTTANEPWDTHKDKELQKLVKHYGTIWEEVARNFFQKTPFECERRYGELMSLETPEQPPHYPTQTELIVNMHFEIDIVNKSFRVVSSDYHTKEFQN